METNINRVKSTYGNTSYNLWLQPAHSENPIGFSSGLGFVCYISCSIHATAHSLIVVEHIKTKTDE